MSSFKKKITDVLKLQPLKPCDALSDEELLDEEVKTRGELGRLVASLSLHVGTCAAHGALSAGATVPFHLPAVVWIAYSLTKCAKRHRALRIELRQQHRCHLKKKNMKNKRIAASIILGLISPILAALGADIISEIVTALAGSDTLLHIGSSSDNSGFKVMTAKDDGVFQIDGSSDFNITKEVRGIPWKVNFSNCSVG